MMHIRTPLGKTVKGVHRLAPEVVRTMRGTKPGVRVIDLFCGAGGFSEGFHQSGFDVVYGIDFWVPACETHTLNGLGVTEKMGLLKTDVDDILEIKRRLEAEHGAIDIVIGSPPCTEFSFAKKGGRGNIEKGMLLVRKHLMFVSVFRPKYWLMENVPRLEHVLDRECEKSSEGGWTISYEKRGYCSGLLTDPSLRLWRL
jgi:site-specific DNA-cytosine methylase